MACAAGGSESFVPRSTSNGGRSVLLRGFKFNLKNRREVNMGAIQSGLPGDVRRAIEHFDLRSFPMISHHLSTCIKSLRLTEQFYYL